MLTEEGVMSLMMKASMGYLNGNSSDSKAF